jgi:hypothetical protein
VDYNEKTFYFILLIDLIVFILTNLISCIIQNSVQNNDAMLSQMLVTVKSLKTFNRKEKWRRGRDSNPRKEFLPLTI